MSAMGSRVEMSDLMEGSFWEEHKAKIGGVIALVVVAIMGWQWFDLRKESAESAGWAQLYDTQFDVRPNIDPNGEVASTSAAPWALYHSAVKAFHDGDYSKSETLIQQLRSNPGFALVNQGRRVDSLAEDVAAEKSFRATNPQQTAAPEGSDRTLTLTTEVGEVQIALYGDAPKGLVLKVLGEERAGKLKDASVDVTDEPGELVCSFAEVPAETTIASLLEPADLDTLRREGARSNLEGSVSVRLLAAETDGEVSTDAKPSRLALSFALEDATGHDDGGVVIGVLNKGLSELREVSKRKTNDKGRLEATLKVTGVVESATLAEIK